MFHHSLTGTGGCGVALQQRQLCWAGGILRGEPYWRVKLDFSEIVF